MKETILVVGGPESGKTTALVQVAIDNPDMPFFAFDTEYNIERVCSFFGGVPANLTILDAITIQEMRAAMEQQVIPAFASTPLGYGGVLIDMVENVWERAQNEMASLKGVDTGTLAANSNNPLTGGFESGDWGPIKKWYFDIVQYALIKLRCNVFMTAGQKEIIEDKGQLGRASYLAHDPRLVEIWKDYGYIPAGEKSLSYNVSTALGLEASGLIRKTFKLTLAKDRARSMRATKKFKREILKPSEVRFEGTEDETEVYNIWRSLSQLRPDFVYPFASGSQG